MRESCFARIAHKVRNGQFTAALRNRLSRATRYYSNRVRSPLSQEILVRGLRVLGLERGDLVCVHSKFSALGYVEGGPTTLIKALEEVVGPTGTIMMPSFSMAGSMLSYLNSGETFNVLTTPSKVGAVTETFRTWPGVRRSLHPTNSVTAKGPLALELLKEHECSLTPYGLDTPLGRLAPLGGKILMVSTHIHSFLHHVQDLVDFPNYYLEGTRKALVVNETGQNLTIETKAMRPRVPYYLVLPGTEGYQYDYALWHDYALIFPESRKSRILQVGYRLNNHPNIWHRQETLTSNGTFRAVTIGAARVGLLDAASYLSHLRPELESILKQFHNCYDPERIEAMNLPYI